jgi:ubiquinone/menaquinone biosynthesis C-methylase UbiE|tara:strand:- start:6815 stop:7426 length:612 start_codon:yes stop_codon:yes gene_type:complete
MTQIRLNLGCASRLLPDYINIDMDSLDEIKRRYPNIQVPDNIAFLVGDALNLDFDDESVDEVRADALLEHFSFLEEPKFFREAARVLKPGGVLRFSVPDFEDAVRKWLDAEDDWKDFFRNDDEAIENKHWFGNYSYSTENRWGYLMASIFGPQNGEGQFHKNAYTEKKIEAICQVLGFGQPKIDRFLWKGDRDLMLEVEMRKL